MTFLDLFDQQYSEEKEAEAVTWAKSLPPVKGIVILDASGSMLLPNGNYSRLQIAAAIAAELKIRGCTVYASSGRDSDQSCATMELEQDGYSFWMDVKRALFTLGGGGIFLEKAVKHISHYHVKPDNLFVFTDEQNSYTPLFGKRVIIQDVTSRSYEEVRDAIG